MDRVNIIGPAPRHLIISTYSGADEKQKLEAAFALAPPWLLWFTFADYTAKLLDLRIPDLSTVTRFLRSEANFHIWWGLPTGAFERMLSPRGHEQEPLARTDLNLLRPTRNNSVQRMTRREQMRERVAFEKSNRDECQRHWPDLLPLKVLKLSRSEFLSLNESLNHRNRDFHHATIGQPSPKLQ
jgi:hypothetical protein